MSMNLRHIEVFHAVMKTGTARPVPPRSCGTNVVPRALKRFQIRHPDVAITFQARLSSEVKELVASGQFDVGLAADEIDLAGVDVRSFQNYRVEIAVLKGHALAAQEVVRPADLDRQSFIALSPEDTTRRQAEAIFADHDVQPKIVLENPIRRPFAPWWTLDWDAGWSTR